MRRTNLISLAALVATLAFVACSDTTSSDNEDLPFSPSNCADDKPLTGPFRVIVNVNAEFPSVPITIYRGDIEDNIIELKRTMVAPSRTFQLDTDKSFAVLALYVIGADTVGVLDSDHVDAFEKEYRDRYCWEIHKGEVDLRLRIRP